MKISPWNAKFIAEKIRKEREERRNSTEQTQDVQPEVEESIAAEPVQEEPACCDDVCAECEETDTDDIDVDYEPHEALIYDEEEPEEENDDDIDVDYEPHEVSDEDENQNFSLMDIDELRELARKHGVSNYWSKGKEKLIEGLLLNI
jgi:hypothetical protein